MRVPQSEWLSFLNSMMHDGQCPTAGSLGECAAIDADAGNRFGTRFLAFLYLWDDKFTDARIVAGWFRELGACEINISHVLWDDNNGDADGRTIGGARPWVVSFFVAGATIDGFCDAPTTAAEPVGFSPLADPPFSSD